MEVAEQVSEMLMDIFNISLESGRVPEDCRVANVTSLFKKGSREELGTQAVSLTSVVRKVLETLIKDQMRNHLKKYKVIKGSHMGLPKVGLVSQIFSSSMKQCLIGWMREWQWTKYIQTLRRHLIRYTSEVVSQGEGLWSGWSGS